ncbi:unnamed protein product [Acanthocheilonema viteae]|uniref:Maelstrom domain-containing protein n=1 Tax=Acanthocheilonema viteae TaxID=6277 RepID=A0A498SE67_ACAVI|nr:unnamed protein product [Acanthocheilonema viteae]
MEYSIKPKMEQKLGKRLRTVDVLQFGLPRWDELSFEEKEEWKERAKEYNKSKTGRNQRILRRLEYHQRKQHVDEQKNFAQPYISRKLKPSKIIPPSRRYDEVDQYSRKYFSGIDDDFEEKRENDRKEFIDRYQWKFAQKDLESKKKFFYESEIIFVTANVYYEDSSNERLIPSEISILKFSIRRGIYDHRHYVLGFAENGILCKNSEVEAEENEQTTGLLMDCSKMTGNARFDYVQIWDEIKEFTKIAGDSVKLLLLSKDWNVVVGSFDALFMHANEKSFSRIETRFAILEDYFMVIYAIVHDVCINNSIKSDVAIEMNKSWCRDDLMMCDFHDGLKYTKQYQARNCSLFIAHKAVFSFLKLCKKHVFPACKFAERHIPNKELLPTVEDDFLERTSQQWPYLRSSIDEAGYSSVDSIAIQSISLPLPKKITLKSNMMKETASAYSTGRAKSAATVLEKKTKSACNTIIDKDSELGSMTNQIGFHYHIKKWLDNQPFLPNADSCETSFFSCNPHVSDASTLDKHYAPVDRVTDQQLFSTSQFTSFSAHRPYREIPLHRDEGQKSNFGVTKSQKSLSFRSSTDDIGFSNVVINSNLNKILPSNEKDEVLVDLSLIDNDSDAELFCDASIPSSLCGQGSLMQASQQLAPRISEAYQNYSFLKISNKVRQTSLSPKKIEATHNTIKNVPESYHDQLVSTHNTYPLSEKLDRIFNQDMIIPSRRESKECGPNFIRYPQKTPKLPLPNDNLIPERTSGGFCIPDFYQKNCPYIRRNRSATSTSYRQAEDRQKNINEKSGIIANQMIMPRNPHASNQSVARNEQKERKADTSADKLQHHSSSSPTQPLLVNNTDGYKCTSQKVNVTKPFILEPLICKEAEMFGWSENVQNVSEQKFTRWLNSMYFESEISRSNT